MWATIGHRKDEARVCVCIPVDRSDSEEEHGDRVSLAHLQNILIYFCTL